MIWKQAHPFEKILTLALLLICLGGLYVAVLNGETAFNTGYAPEDGLIEYGTAIFLALAGIYMIYTLFKYRSGKNWLWIMGTLIIGLLFIFGAGEEISWGQRIFGFETGENLRSINKQGETNLHNIKIGELDINKLIFSKLLTISLVIYLLIIPFFLDKWTWMRNTLDKFGVPLPFWRQTIAFLIMSLIIAPIVADKKWELYELGFSIVFFIIFLFPQNEKRIR
jgi:hypothetical protein